MTSPPKSADKNLPSETTLLSLGGLPCMERLNDESEVHFKDKATAIRKAPRLCAVVGSNFSMDKSGTVWYLAVETSPSILYEQFQIPIKPASRFETGAGDELIRKKTAGICGQVDSLNVPSISSRVPSA